MPNSRAVVRDARRATLRHALAVAVVLLATSSCAGGVGAAPTPHDPHGRPVVLASFTVLADMAAVVAGDDAVVGSVTGPGAEIHGYEPSPDDLRRAAGADLLLVNGLGLEAWLEGLVAPLDLPTVVLTEGIDPLPVDPARPDGPANPHAWMSPLLGRVYVTAIAEALAEADPADAAAYRARARAYADRLTALHAELTERLASVPERSRHLVTCEGAFSYLARDAGLVESFLWPVNAERQGTPRQVAATIDVVREHRVPTVFCESTVASTAQEQVADEAGARLGPPLYVDSLSGPDGPVPTYLDLLEHDVEVIVEGLTP